MKTAIHWFRRDLRLKDNSALVLALRSAKNVIPIFCWDDHILSRPDVGAPRVWFLLESLKELSLRIDSVGGRLVILRGKPEEQIPAYAHVVGAEAVFFNSDCEPYARSRDRRISERLEAMGIKSVPCEDLLLVEPGTLLSAQGTPYSMFTPFWKAWLAVEKRKPDYTEVTFHFRSEESSDALPDLNQLDFPLPDDFNTGSWIPGEQAALERLKWFKENALSDYESSRDIPGIDGTSRISPYLKFGNISMRQALETAGGNDKFINELCWREFYFHVLWHWPEVESLEWQKDMRRLQWDDSPDMLEAWKNGMTGYPFVDAGMRQLLSEGWMHNRVRMVVASFLTKDLHLDWRLGERHFMLRLVDGDLAPNNGGWQWAAGTGVDPRPLRIFNPYLQSERFDPKGDYIRRWVPELSRLPDHLIHKPHLMTKDDQVRYGCIIGRDYPAPIVDHAVERQFALARYAEAKAGQGRLEL